MRNENLTFTLTSGITSYSGTTCWIHSGTTDMTVRSIRFEDRGREHITEPKIHYVDRVVIKEVPITNQVEKIVYINKEIPMHWDVWNVVVVMLICIATVKFLIPRITIKRFAKLIVHCAYWPIKKLISAIRSEVKESINEEENQDGKN